MSHILSRSIASLLPSTPRLLRQRFGILAAAAVLSAASSAEAANGTWTLDAGGTWGTTTNWVGGTVANGTDAVADFSTIDITANRTVNLGGNFTVGSLIFGDATTASNNWTLAAGTPAGTLTLATSTGGPTINVVNQTATISAPLAGTQGFTKTGSGVLTLSGNNSGLTGGIFLSAGTLNFTATGLGTNLVDVTAAATLGWQGTTTVDISSQLKIEDGVTATLAAGANNVTLASAIQTGALATASITKTGAGTLTITAANTFTGLTKISVGRIVLANGNNRLAASGSIGLGQGANAGILQLGDATAASNQTTTSLTIAGTATTNAVVGGNASVSTLTVNNSTAVTYAGLLGGTGTNENNLALTKTGSGVLTLSNTGNTFTGGVTLSQGTLSFAAGSLGTTGLINFTAASTLQWGTGNTSDLSARIKLNDGIVGTVDTNGNSVTFATPLQTGAAATAGLTKGGTGTLTITATNTYTGNTRVNNGRLIITGGNDRLSPSTSIQLGNAATSGVLQLGDASGPSNQTVRGLAVTGNASSIANAVVGGSESISTLTINNTAAVTYAGFLGGTGTNEDNLALTKTGGGTLTLGGINTFKGDVSISGGAVIIKSPTALGAGTKTIFVNGATNSPSLRLDGTGGSFALPTGFSLVTSNDNSASPALLNIGGNNTISGTISPTTGGAGAGNTRIQVQAGTLTLTGNIAPAPAAASSLTLILDGSANGTVTGSIGNTGANSLGVTKEGTGTWTLTGANTYSGATQISGGRLNLTTAQTGTGALTLADGATFGLTLVAVGQSLNPATLNLGTTTGTTVALDLGSFGNPTAPIINTSALTVNSSTTIGVSALGLSVTDGVLVPYIPLFHYTTLGGLGFAGFTLGALPSRVQATLVDQSATSTVSLNVTAFDVPKWTGAIDGVWNIDDGTGTVGTLNWKLSNNSTTGYYQGGLLGTDSVVFDDSATGTKVVDLSTTLEPATATVNTVSSYTFQGAGKLSGATKLNKQGSGRLILLNTGGNDYTGTTTISDGTLQIGDGTTIGAGQLGTGAIVNNGTLELNRPDNITLANVFSGTGTVRKLAPSTVTLSANNPAFDGPIEIVGGTLKVGNASALGSTTGRTIIQSSGALDSTGFSIAENIDLIGGKLLITTGTANAITGNVTLAGGGTAEVALGASLTLTSPITGTGGLTKTNAGTLIVTANASYTGGTIISQGTLQFGATSGTGIIGAPGDGDIVLSPAAGNSATLAILRADTALNVANTISSAGAGTNAISIGVGGATSPSGAVTFSGANTFTGNVSILGGSLKITNGSALGNGSKTVTIGNAARPGLLLDGGTSGISLANSINYAISSDGAGTATGSAAGAIVSVSGDNQIGGNISLINGGGGNGRVTVQAGSLTLNGNVDANGATGVRTLLIGGAARGVINGVISDFNASATTAVSLTKDGAGTWEVNGANTFTGAVTVSDGTLKVASVAAAGTAQPLGTGSGVVTLGTATTAGTLEYEGAADATLSRGITVGGVGGGVVKNSGGATLTLAGTITRASRPLAFGGGSITVTGQITGASAALNVAAGIVTFSQTTNNYVGATNIFGGATLRNGASEVLPNGTALNLGEATTNTGGTYDLNGFSESITGLSGAGTGAKFITNSAASGTSTLNVLGGGAFDGIMQDGATASVGLTKSTSGVLTLSGANTYTGATTISGSTLEVNLLANGGAASGIGASTSAATNLTLNGGTLRYVGAAQDSDREFTLGTSGGTLDASGTGALSFTSTAAITLPGIDTARTLTLAGTNTGANTLGLVLTDNGIASSNLVKTGPGNWTLTSANSFSGTTTLNGGTLTLGHSGALEKSTLNLTTTGATLSFGTLTSATIGGLQGSQTLSLTNSVSAPVALVIGGNNGNATFSGALTGSGSLQKTGSGTLVLSGTDSYAGATLVSAGTLTAGSDSALPRTTELTVAAGAAFDAAGFSLTISSLSGDGTFLNSGGAATLSLESGVFTGQINAAFSPLGLRKVGAGTLTLSGANQYAGPTSVEGGTFLVSGSISGTAPTVGAGATLGGTGVIHTSDQPFSLLLGGKLAPGLGLGALTIDAGTGNVDLTAGLTPTESGALVFDLLTPESSDRLVISEGSLLIGDGLLSFADFAFNPQQGFVGGTYLLISSASAITGQLDPQSAHLTGTIAGFESTLSLEGNGTQVVLTVVPEPNSLASLVGGLGVLLGLQRRRKAR